MFALIAFILILLAAVGVELEQIRLLWLGVAFWALHFAFPFYPWNRNRKGG